MSSENNIGRPSGFTPEIAEAICVEIANGKSVREICREDWMPAMSTVFRWLAAHEDFREQYARAKEAMADYMAEEMLEIADDATNDWMDRQVGENSIRVVDHEHIGRSKLRLDTRKWLMSKMLPKKYGDAIRQEIGGPNGGPIEVADPASLDVARRIAFVLAQGARAAGDNARAKATETEDTP